MRPFPCFIIALCSAGLSHAAPASGPASRGVDGPLAALQSLSSAIRNGDREKMAVLLEARTKSERKLAVAMQDTAVASVALQRAMSERFGPEAAKAISASRGGIDPAAMKSSAVRMDGDRAVVEIAEGAARSSITLVRTEGAWKVPIAELMGGPALVEKMLANMRAFAKVMEETAAAITAGNYQSAEEAQRALKKSLDAAILANQLPATTSTSKAVK